MDVEKTAAAAKSACAAMAALPGDARNKALLAVVRALHARADDILQANAADVAAAQREGLGAAMLKRLIFNESRIAEVCAQIDSLVKMDELVGRVLSATELDSGLVLRKVACPIGVIGAVFESRPDALVQIAALCLKSGNTVLMKGGAEAESTNKMLAGLIVEAACNCGAPAGWMGLLHGREQVIAMLKLDLYVDLLIPRGSNQFVRYIMDNTHIPVLGHADGVCSVYVDGAADLEMAARIVVDSKCQYPAVCNAAETLLVDIAVAENFVPTIAAMLAEKGVQIRGCRRTAEMTGVVPVCEDDWSAEYLDLVLSVRVVEGLDGAVEHINRYGSGHTDCIVTGDGQRAARFMDLVDSANVFWNCSTRFSDGFRYGLGAEVGISTGRLHARGPVGLEGLCTYKWKLFGNGQVVADYVGPGARKFTHKKVDA